MLNQLFFNKPVCVKIYLIYKHYKITAIIKNSHLFRSEIFLPLLLPARPIPAVWVTFRSLKSDFAAKFLKGTMAETIKG